MNWLEVIELRAATGKRESLDLYLTSLVENVNRKSGKMVLKIFSHVAIDCDYMIQIHHQSPQTEINGSDLGLRLVDSLKDFGLVNQTVWVEKLSS